MAGMGGWHGKKKRNNMAKKKVCIRTTCIAAVGQGKARCRGVGIQRDGGSVRQDRRSEVEGTGSQNLAKKMLYAWATHMAVAIQAETKGWGGERQRSGRSMRGGDGRSEQDGTGS